MHPKPKYRAIKAEPKYTARWSGAPQGKGKGKSPPPEHRPSAPLDGAGEEAAWRMQRYEDQFRFIAANMVHLMAVCMGTGMAKGLQKGKGLKHTSKCR